MTKARRIHRTLIAVALLTVAVVAACGFVIRGRSSSVNWLSLYQDAEVSQAQRGLATGGDPNAASPGEHTPLIAAINVQRSDLVRALLNAGANPNLPSLGGETPLLAAVTHPSEEIFQLILDAGANPDAKDGRGNTALTFELLTAGRLARIQSLIQYGADLNLVGADGHTHLEAAATGGTPELIELCLGYGTRSGSAEMRGPLEWAAWAGKLENVQCLLKHGANLEARDQYGMTVLMELVKYERQYKMVEAFILAGADVNARLSPDGSTPLRIAKMHRNWQVVELLEKHGAKP